MKTVILAALALLLASPLATATGSDLVPHATFRAYDIFIDAGSHPVAAWQVELRLEGPGAMIVGIEGGETPAWICDLGQAHGQPVPRA